MRLAILVAPVTLILVGCTAEARPAAFAERDSAGVRIVEYADTPVASRTLRLSETPVYRIGDGPGEREFAFVSRGALQPDGGAVLVDGMRGQEVLLVGPDGSIRSVLARDGQGPREVRGVSAVLVPGQDTILIQDGGNAKLMFFTGEQLVRSVSLGSDPMFAFTVGSVGYEPPGTALMMTQGFRAVGQGSWIQGHFIRFDLESGTADTVGAFDLANQPPREGPFNPFRPFGMAGLSGVSLVSARSDVAELTWRDTHGAVRQVMRWKPRLAYPTEADLETLNERMLESGLRFNEGNSREQIEQRFRRFAERHQFDAGQPFPFFGRLLPDGTGGVWLADYGIGPTPDGEPHWSVVAADGEWLGSVTTPPRFRILDVRGDRVLGVLSDELDVQSVAVFTVTSGALPR